jgi:transcriptional regulator with XRE-family HTH domain
MPINAAALKAARERLGLTQEQVAHAVGYRHRESLARIEDGTRKRVDTSIVARLAAVLKVRESEIRTD